MSVEELGIVDSTCEDGACRCGWALPLSVVAFAVGRDPNEDEPLPATFVALLCPNCHDSHLFFNGADDESRSAGIGAIEKRRSAS